MKYLRIMAVLLALAMGLVLTVTVVGLFGLQHTELAEDVVVVESQALAGPKVPYYAFLDIEDLETSTWYSLVDLDNRTNFPHYRANSVVLKQLHYTGVLSDALHFDVRFGVVITMGDDASLIDWFHVSHRVRATQFDEKWTLPEHGLNLYVNTTNEDLGFVATKEYTTTVAVTTTTALESPVTESGVVTIYAEVGDIIMYVEEVDAGGHIDLSVGVAYDTQ